MPRDPTLTSLPTKSAAPPPEMLVKIHGKWQNTLRATRRRKILCYELSVLFVSISILVSRYWASAYRSYCNSITFVARSPEELASACQSTLGAIARYVGLAALAIGFAGLLNAIWIKLLHEKKLGRLRDETIQKDWSNELSRCGGGLDIFLAPSGWEEFQQRNRRFLLGYLFAMSTGLALVVTSYLL
jgi:hypothetical protein